MSKADQAKRIPMPQVLRYFGYPCPDRGGVIKSPFREAGNEDENESLSVFLTSKGRWYWTDHGTGKPGSSIDIVMHEKGLAFGDAVDYLINTFSFSMDSACATPATKTPKTTQTTAPKTSDKVQTEQITELRDARSLVYVMGRGVTLEAIHGAGIEIKTVQITNGRYKNLYSSFPTRSGQTLRAIDANPRRCRFVGPADMTIFGRQDAEHVFVFESIIDSLSFLTMCTDRGYCFVSLNSTQNTNLFLENTEFLKNKKLWLYLDMDKPGDVATKKIIKAHPAAADCRETLMWKMKGKDKKKDVNDFLQCVFLAHEAELVAA